MQSENLWNDDALIKEALQDVCEIFNSFQEKS